MIAIAVVEAGAPAPPTFRIVVVAALDLTVTVPVVARSFNDCKGNEPHGDAGKHASTVAGLSVIDVRQDDAQR